MTNKLSYQNKYAYFNGQAIPYKLFYRDNKNVYIRINRELEIEVIANRHISSKSLDGFINQHIGKLDQMIKHRKANEQINQNFESMQIYGKKYRLKFIQLNKPKAYEIINNDIFLNIKRHDDKLILIKKILIDTTTPYIKQRFNFWAKRMRVNAQLLFKWMTTKWGVCNTREHKITLSLQLGTNSKAAIDYVIVHELSHLYHPDHSIYFWEFVASYIPNWKALRNEINLKL